MTEERVPAGLEVLVRAIAGGSHDDDDERATTFARGLVLGALVGAAIAGSTIWQRRHARPMRAPDSARAATPGPSAPGPSGGTPQPAPDRPAPDAAEAPAPAASDSPLDPI